MGSFEAVLQSLLTHCAIGTSARRAARRHARNSAGARRMWKSVERRAAIA